MAFDGEILDFVESDLIEVDLSVTEDLIEDETTVHITLGLDTTGASEGDAITIVGGVPAWAPNPAPEVTQAELDAVAKDSEAFAFYLAG